MPYQRGHIGGGASQGGTKGGKSFQGESGGFPQNGLTLTKPSHNKTTVEPVHIPSAMKSPPPISPLLPKDPTASQGLKKAPEPVVTSLDELKVVESTISGPIQELPPAILNARTQQAVVVTHMVNPGLLFVRQAGPESVYKTIVKDLAKTSAQSLQPGTIVAGFIIGIRLPNGSLYRGYVKEVKESQVEVYLLDTGVIVHIPDGSCFPLRHTLLSVPAQAVPCVLANVAPVERTWKPEDMTTAKQILALDDMASVPLFASVIGMMDRGQPVVTLVDEEFTDIGKFLTEVKVAQLISCDYKPFAPIAWMKEGTLKVKVPPSQLMVSAEEGCIPSMEDACVSGSLAYHIPMGTKTQGGCLHVEGEDMYMLVIPVEEALQEKLHQLVGNGFSENVNSFEEIPLSKVPLGSIVAAPYEGAWYRAYVIEKGSSACKVFFIDFGNQGSAETFRKIPASFRDFPGLAMKASIYSKVSLTDRDKAIFADMQAMKISQVNVEVVEKRDDRMRVKVLDGDHIPKNNLSLILSPWYKKFHSQTPSSPNLPEAQQESIVTSLLPSERQVPLADHLQWPQLIVGRRYQVICPFMLSLEKIFAQFLDQKELLGRLATALESYGKTEHGKWAGQAYAPLQGEVVAAIFPADQVWYRAKVLNIPGNGTIRVEFIDYGNEEVIPASNACPLPKDLAKDYPVLAVTVCLEGGNTLNLTEDANPVIFSMSVNPVTMVVKDALSQPAVVDFELEDGRTLTQLLKGEPAPTPPPPNPIQLTKNPINNEASGPTYDLESFPVGSLPIGEKVNLIPISVDTPNNFYCWLDDKNGLDDFRAFTDKMKSHCEKTVALQPSPYHPQQCEVFLAFSIQYGEWYRAACLEITTEQMIVLYVDFGSMETISLNDSQCLPLTPELAQQPAQAHFCCLPVVSLGEPKFPLEATTIMLNVLPLNISFEAIAISHDSSIQQYTIMHKPSIQALVEKGLARSSE
ncbi:unnamed protein product [Darwinula stevensoni]|uniref:Tudor domain-containing protein n=1 Tax=Darwinula stevensoni TaxID=69355 RepID=A0A7R8X2Q1_9CRUS|nr:unnamed protein product [Darwinula stevensoni]CAG0884183.1 unnamed protein product [Darwinula stevensoni]